MSSQFWMLVGVLVVRPLYAAKMPAEFRPPPLLTLQAPLQWHDSGSEPFLGLLSDGGKYWVKHPDNPQGARSLVAEAVVYGIGQLIDAPVPANALVEIPRLGRSFRNGKNIGPGVGHASLEVAEAVVVEEWDTYSLRDDNGRRQARILGLWDLCMGNDPQWLHQVTKEYSIWSFDHGFWLAGESDWTIESLRGIAEDPWQHELDLGCASEAGLREAADLIDNLTLEALQSVTRSVPLSWNVTAEELSELASILFVRAEGVADRLWSAAR